MKTSIPFAAVFVSGIAATLIGCSTTDTCSNTAYDTTSLFEFQKEKNFFGLPKNIHYRHSDGFELDMKQALDSLYKEKHVEFCYESTDEHRLLKYESSYPITEIDIHLYSNQYEGYVNISFASNEFNFTTDPKGFPDDNFEMLDTVRFNGKLYDSVYVIPGYRFLSWQESKYDREDSDSLAHAFISRTKGILGIITTYGDSLTIMEESEDDNE